MKGYLFSVSCKNKSNPLYEDYLEIMNQDISNEEKINKIYKFICDLEEYKKHKKENDA